MKVLRGPLNDIFRIDIVVAPETLNVYGDDGDDKEALVDVSYFDERRLETLLGLQASPCSKTKRVD